jgi:hypothetical protein
LPSYKKTWPETLALGSNIRTVIANPVELNRSAARSRARVSDVVRNRRSLETTPGAWIFAQSKSPYVSLSAIVDPVLLPVEPGDHSCGSFAGSIQGRYIEKQCVEATFVDLKLIEREAVLSSSQDLALYLQIQLGQKLTAYITGLADPKIVGRWATGKTTPRDTAKLRLRIAFHATRLLVEAYGQDTAKAWLLGVNEALDDEAPAWVVRNAKNPDGLRFIIPLAKEFVGEGLQDDS